jgi:RHS repeat-associated protein
VVSSYAGIAVRTSVGTPTVTNQGTVAYLHSDHLGSVSVTTTGGGAISTWGNIIESQNFDPWGGVRSGGITATEFNYTGQRKDAGTGLLFYNARYYDPGLGRFVQADSVVPNTSRRALTVDFHEVGFVRDAAKENNQGFWFQLSDRDRQKATVPWGSDRPQDLNRYSYANNNPLRYNDPSGHEWRTVYEGDIPIWQAYALIGALQQKIDALTELIKFLDAAIEELEGGHPVSNAVAWGIGGAVGVLAGAACAATFGVGTAGAGALACLAFGGFVGGALGSWIYDSNQASRDEQIAEYKRLRSIAVATRAYLRNVITGLRSAIAQAEKDGRRSIHVAVYVYYQHGVPMNIEVQADAETIRLFK